MSPRVQTPTGDASVIGLRDRDRGRDVAAFFAAYPFGGAPATLEQLPANAFFEQFLSPPRPTR